MNLKTLALLLALGVLGPSPASAIGIRPFDLGACWPKCITKFCCDDYCPKAMPCVSQNCRFVCDDYCPKPAPCARRIRTKGCDDYCKKPLPRIHCPTRSCSSCRSRAHPESVHRLFIR